MIVVVYVITRNKFVKDAQKGRICSYVPLFIFIIYSHYMQQTQNHFLHFSSEDTQQEISMMDDGPIPKIDDLFR